MCLLSFSCLVCRPLCRHDHAESLAFDCRTGKGRLSFLKVMPIFVHQMHRQPLPALSKHLPLRQRTVQIHTALESFSSLKKGEAVQAIKQDRPSLSRRDPFVFVVSPEHNGTRRLTLSVKLNISRHVV